MEQTVKTNHSTPAPVEVPSVGPAPFQGDPSSRNLARAVSLYIQGDSEHALEALAGAEAGIPTFAPVSVCATRTWDATPTPWKASGKC